MWFEYVNTSSHVGMRIHHETACHGIAATRKEFGQTGANDIGTASIFE
jgi:hypothetical protein